MTVDAPMSERVETAERRFLAAALDYGCTEITAQSRVSAVMRRFLDPSRHLWRGPLIGASCHARHGAGGSKAQLLCGTDTYGCCA